MDDHFGLTHLWEKPRLIVYFYSLNEEWFADVYIPKWKCAIYTINTDIYVEIWCDACFCGDNTVDVLIRIYAKITYALKTMRYILCLKCVCMGHVDVESCPRIGCHRWFESKLWFDWMCWESRQKIDLKNKCWHKQNSCNLINNICPYTLKVIFTKRTNLLQTNQ